MEVMLCSICSLSCGICEEDCGFCAQNVNAKIKTKYNIKSIKEVLMEAKIASDNHALGFCLVTSGWGLDDKKTQEVAKIARAVNKEFPNLMLIACNGMATTDQLKELKNAGVFSYNHNLESSKEFFPNICTSHTWEERYITNLNAKDAGLELCCGGIYGLGESEEDRISFRKSLKELKPFSSPINFFINSPSLKLNVPMLTQNEAFKIIDESVKDLKGIHIMVAGGREVVLKERQYEIFEHGVSAMVLGDYLTTKGENMHRDIIELQKRGYKFLKNCH